jgi:Domain of unknown function (DUF3846)
MAEIEVIHFKVGFSQGQLVKVSNDLEPLQALVGGPIEMVRMRWGLVLLCHEEGLIRRLPVGFAASTLIGLKPIRGDFFICRVDGPEFASVHLKDHRLVQGEVFTL